MLCVLAKMRDITVINRVRRMKVVWIIESLCLQVDLFLKVLMIVMSLWHSKRLWLSCRCFRWYLTYGCICLLRAGSLTLAVGTSLVCIVIVLTEQPCQANKLLLVTESLRSSMLKCAEISLCGVHWCFSIIPSVWLISCISAISKELFIAFQPG